jgi:hypothetical protein
VRRLPAHHVELLDLAVALGDGAHRYDNAQFAYLRSVLPPEITALATAYSFEAVSFHMMLGRFPAYLNVLSIRHFFEDRVLAIDNALLDAIVATPPRLRLDGLAYRAALRRLAPDLWRIPDGNIGMRPGTHPLVLYARDRGRDLRRRAGLYRPPSLPDPAFTERSWPNMVELIRQRPLLAERMAKILADPDALPPDLFDSAAVARLLARARRALSRRAGGGRRRRAATASRGAGAATRVAAGGVWGASCP